MTKLNGNAAIDYAETHGLTLAKYEDPTEAARNGLTVDEARQVASEDPSLVYLELAGAHAALVEAAQETGIDLTPEGHLVYGRNAAGGHIAWVSATDDGKILVCEDEASWEIDPADLDVSGMIRDREGAAAEYAEEMDAE